MILSQFLIVSAAPLQSTSSFLSSTGFWIVSAHFGAET
jgi:hypothetical protein